MATQNMNNVELYLNDKLHTMSIARSTYNSNLTHRKNIEIYMYIFFSFFLHDHVTRKP